MVAVLLASNVQGSMSLGMVSNEYAREKIEEYMKPRQEMDLTELLTTPWWDIIAITLTNLILRPNPDSPFFIVLDKSRDEHRTRGAWKYVENNEDVIFALDREIVITDSLGVAAL